LLHYHLLTTFLLQLLGAFGYLIFNLWRDKHFIFLKLFLALLLFLISLTTFDLFVLRLGELGALSHLFHRAFLLQQRLLSLPLPVLLVEL
jgi:hypothetical protein